MERYSVLKPSQTLQLANEMAAIGGKQGLIRYVHKTWKSDYYIRHACLSVRPSVRMEQFGSHWMYIH